MNKKRVIVVAGLMLGAVIAAPANAQPIALDPITLPASAPSGSSLWFSTADVAMLRGRIPDPGYAPYFASVHGQVDSQLDALATAPATLSDDTLARIAKGAALLHHLGEPSPASFPSYAAACVEALLNVGPRNPGAIIPPADVIDVLQDSGRLQSMAEGRDMLRGTGLPSASDQAPIEAMLADWANALRDDINLTGVPFPPVAGHRDNWGIKAGSALVTTALAMPTHASAASWSAFGQQLLNESLARVTSPVGWYREGPHYVNYSLNNLVSTAWHVRHAGSAEWFDDLEPLVRASLEMRQPDGSSAPFEDGVPNVFPHDVMDAAYPALGPRMAWAWAGSNRDTGNYDNQQIHDATRFIVTDPAIVPEAPRTSPTRFLGEDAHVHVLASSWDASATQVTMITALDHDSSTTYASRHHVQNPLDLCFFASGAMQVVTASGGPQVTQSANRAEYLDPRSKGSPLVDGTAPFVTNPADIASSDRCDAHDTEGLPNSWADLAATRVAPYAAASSVTRTIAFVDGSSFIVADEMQSSAQHEFATTWRGRGTRSVMEDTPDLARVSWQSGVTALDVACVGNGPQSLLLRASLYAPSWGVEENIDAAHSAVTGTDVRRLALVTTRDAAAASATVTSLSTGGVAALRFKGSASSVTTLAALGPRGVAWSTDAISRADAALALVREDGGSVTALALTDALALDVRGVPLLAASIPVTLVLTLSPDAVAVEMSQDQAGPLDLSLLGLPGMNWSAPHDVLWNGAAWPEAQLRRSSTSLDVLGLADLPGGGSLVIRPPGGLGDLGNVGPTLRLSGEELTWAAAIGATGYKLRRSLRAEFLRIAPPPSDADLLASPITTNWTDAQLPGDGRVFYYFVNAVAPPAESAD